MLRVAEEGLGVKDWSPPDTRIVRWSVRSLAAAALLLLASCASVPQKPAVDWLGVLPRDATMYLSALVPRSAEVIRKTLKEAGPGYNDVITLSDMTQRLLMSVSVPKEKGAPLRFAAVALGGYPSFLIGLSLGGNKEWKQHTVPDGSYYLWNKANLQLSLPAGGLILATNDDMPILLSRFKNPETLLIPSEVAEDMTKTDIVVYLPQLPGGMGESSTGQPGAEESNGRPHLGVRDVWVEAMKTKDGYLLGGTVNTSTDQQARALSFVMRVGIIAWMKSTNVPDVAARLRTITVTPDGASVRVKGVAVSEKEIVPLIVSLLNGGPAPAGDAAAPAAGQGS